MTSIYLLLVRTRRLAVCLAGLAVAVPVHAQRLTGGLLGSAGGVSENANYRLTITVGEPAEGSALNGVYHHKAGFLFRSVRPPVGTADQEGPANPDVLTLHPPAPNPSRGTARIWVDLPSPGHVRLIVYDALGREVAVALDDERPAGRHTVDLASVGLASGTYVIRLVADGEVQTQRLTVVR
ncbi:MAG: hypothetical protein Rubg2KO_29650 [Rubricoccaceae bacterium]